MSTARSIHFACRENRKIRFHGRFAQIFLLILPTTLWAGDISSGRTELEDIVLGSAIPDGLYVKNGTVYGTSSTYRIEVGYVAEDNGEPTYSELVNGTTIASWTAVRTSGGQNDSIYRIASIELHTDDRLSFASSANENAMGRMDFVDIIAAADLCNDTSQKSGESHSPPQGLGYPSNCSLDPPISPEPVAGKVTDQAPESDHFPRLLTLENGHAVSSVSEWENLRKPELIESMVTQKYGETPAAARNPANWSTTITRAESKDAVYVDGSPQADLYQARIIWTHRANGRSATADVAVLTPKGETPVPIVFNPNFHGNQAIFEQAWPTHSQTYSANSAATADSGTDVQKWADLLEDGIGVATVHYRNFFEDPDYLAVRDPSAPWFDHANDWQHGVPWMFFAPGQTRQHPGEWGAIGAWSWGMSRIMDHLETLSSVRADRVLLTGLSRLGETAMWTGVQDERFWAVVNPTQSGLHHRMGLSLGNCVWDDDHHYKYPYWYEYNYRNGQNRSMDTHALRFDSHAMLAVQAPRPTLSMIGMQDCADPGPGGADPEGSFDAASYASEVYSLYNPDYALELDSFSAIPVDVHAERYLVQGRSGFAVDPDGHDMSVDDWVTMLKWAASQGFLK